MCAGRGSCNLPPSSVDKNFQSHVYCTTSNELSIRVKIPWTKSFVPVECCPWSVKICSPTFPRHASVSCSSKWATSCDVSKLRFLISTNHSIIDFSGCAQVYWYYYDRNSQKIFGHVIHICHQKLIKFPSFPILSLLPNPPCKQENPENPSSNNSTISIQRQRNKKILHSYYFASQPLRVVA